MHKAFYVTTPIYYVNASPHIGHAYSTILADVMARFHRLAGYKTFFLTGTDEHGDKIVEAAVKAGETPKEYTDRISAEFSNLWPELDITNDYFIRTTDPDHIETVRYILQKVYDAGDIYFGEYEGYYCVGCERFYKESELVDGKCPDHDVEPLYRKESNYFFRMSRYQEWLIQYINDNPDFIRPERYRNEALAFLREPLGDLCISRPKTRLTWGVTLPFDDQYVTYVWFDALINYLTAMGYPDGDNFRFYWPVANHIIAKDILKPHGIYWPTMLKAAGIEPYQHLNVHGYWNIDQGKMSKSRGRVVRPLELKDKYGLDAFRYFLLREMVFGLDSNFNEDIFVERINADLSNDLGNLVSRTLSMVLKYCGGSVPKAASERTAEDKVLIGRAEKLLKDMEAAFESLMFHRALQSIWDFINLTNRYIVTNEPWALAKDPACRERLDTVIYNLLEALRIIAVLINPFMPGTSRKMLAQLGITEDAPLFESIGQWGGLPVGNAIRRGEALFPRIEKQEEAPAGSEVEKLQDIKETITYDDFARVDLRVGLIVAAEKVAKSNKLLNLKVDIGEERTIVAGIAEHYDPAFLIGKKVVIVVNLKPAKLMGIESQGMMLAADKADGLTLLSFDGDATVGARIR